MDTLPQRPDGEQPRPERRPQLTSEPATPGTWPPITMLGCGVPGLLWIDAAGCPAADAAEAAGARCRP
jgi:hypothetical protein